MLKACLNGRRRPGEHRALPVTPAHLASDTLACVAAGAAAVHFHPKDAAGADTLDGATVAKVVEAVRAASPQTPLGLTTGAWAAAGPNERLTAVRGWPVLPDFASVNWHEAGATDIAELLLARGVGVEAGLWTPEAVRSWAGWRYRTRCLRVLLEVVDDLSTGAALAAAGHLFDALHKAQGVPVLLHGEGRSAWPVLEAAVRRGLDVRIGLEDVLVLPDGRPAADNAELVAAAQAVINRASASG
ncbi:MAG: 3-keto-5-aminohexanoate cleavage protein [Candidatus Dormibacteraeota bacterium]|nr:3-keto-5-aminohexanoate cleavage protein [Candidatus Dormibacteraeota bacterium]